MPKKKKAINHTINEEDIRVNCEEISNIEIEDWIITTRKVLIVLSDSSRDEYERIYQDFIYDLQRLKEAKRITDEDYEDILENL